MIKYYLTSLLLTAFFIGCMTEKKARRTAEKFYQEHPGELAGQCSEKFPPSIEYKPGAPVFIPGDTVTIPGDSVPCPDVIPTPGAKPTPGGKVKCPDQKTVTNTIRIVDTMEVENTARVKLLQYRLDTTAESAAKLRGKMEEITKDRDDWKRKARARIWWVCGLILFLAAGVWLRVKG